MTKKELTIIGGMLYACEGTKARRDYRSKDRYTYSIELTNSDPKIIGVFSKFLKEVLNINWQRIRGQLFIYPDLDENYLVKFWSGVSKIPVEQFQKTIVLKQKTGKFKANPLGKFKTRYSCKEDFLKVQKIIDKTWRDAGVV